MVLEIGGVIIKASDLIGKTVINNKAVEVGKVAEISIVLKKCLFDRVVISTGSTLSKKYFEVTESEISSIGDYMQVDLDDAEIEEKLTSDKMDNLIKPEFQYKKFLSKIVLSEDAMEVGKIEDVMIEPEGCLINQLIVTAGPAFRKKRFMLSKDDLKHIGDYVILKLPSTKIGELEGK
ncbi:PRC-barrel domain-containing protein [Methanobacterium congolense]|uniref:PRC-barrel domain-containing protein n=1 Tax=Methanobacterium congolense TaxID=118062 RepID=UPI002F914AD9